MNTVKCKVALLNAATFLAALTLPLGLFACASGKQSQKNDNQSSNNEDEIVLEYGDTLETDAASVEIEDTAIADLNEGVLTAKSTGSTKITLDGVKKKLTVNPAVVDVVLFTGQSNMVGRESSKYDVYIPEGQVYEFKYLSGTLEKVKNPVGETFNEVEVSSGSSILPQFCADYVNSSGRKIVAVHLARGGRSISYFVAGTGPIYNDIIEKYGACIDYLKSNENFEIGHQFYVMYQGESDTNHNMNANTYERYYMRFHNGLKEKFGFEFGALIANGRNSDPDSPEGVKRIGNVKVKLCREHDDIIMADVSVYNWYMTGNHENIRSDLIHLNAEGLKIVAKESCKNILNYMGLGEDPSLLGVDPVTYLEIKER